MFKLNNFKKNKKGFTLIEILIVIGIIAVLAAIVLVAINPARQFRKANNSQRVANVNAILNAIGQYIVDNKGELPAGIPSGTNIDDAEEISSSAVDICDDLVPAYIPALPADPEQDIQSITDCSDYETDYYVFEEDGRVTVIAENTENEEEGGSVPDSEKISVTR